MCVEMMTLIELYYKPKFIKTQRIKINTRVKHHSLGGFRKNLQCSLNQGKNKEMAPHMSFLMSWLIFCITIMPKILRQKKLLAFKEATRLSL